MKVTYTLSKEHLIDCSELMLTGTDEVRESLRKQQKKLYMMGLIPVAVGLFAITRISAGTTGKVSLVLLFVDLAVAGMIYYLGFRYKAVVKRNLRKNLEKRWSASGPVLAELDIGESSLVVEGDGQTSIFLYAEFRRFLETADCLILLFSGDRIVCIPKSALADGVMEELSGKLEEYRKE